MSTEEEVAAPEAEQEVMPGGADDTDEEFVQYVSEQDLGREHVEKSDDEQLETDFVESDEADLSSFSDENWKALLAARSAEADKPSLEAQRAAFEAERAEADRKAKEQAFVDWSRETLAAQRAAIEAASPFFEPQAEETAPERVYGQMDGLSESEIHALVTERINASKPMQEQDDPLNAPALRESEVVEERRILTSDITEMSDAQFAALLKERDAATGRSS